MKQFYSQLSYAFAVQKNIVLKIVLGSVSVFITHAYINILKGVDVPSWKYGPVHLVRRKG
jgi:hypothetical protein